jgi:acyl-CoA synthetase (AMP-forming)/AMP-acid ligase II
MLERSAREVPDKPALISHDWQISFRELYDHSAALAGALVQRGLRKGERVGLLLKKKADAIISFLGITAAGGVAFPIAFNQTAEHIQFILDLTTPSALIVDEAFRHMLAGLQALVRSR